MQRALSGAGGPLDESRAPYVRVWGGYAAVVCSFVASRRFSIALSAIVSARFNSTSSSRSGTISLAPHVRLVDAALRGRAPRRPRH